MAALAPHQRNCDGDDGRSAMAPWRLGGQNQTLSGGNRIRQRLFYQNRQSLSDAGQTVIAMQLVGVATRTPSDAPAPASRRSRKPRQIATGGEIAPGIAGIDDGMQGACGDARMCSTWRRPMSPAPITAMLIGVRSWALTPSLCRRRSCLALVVASHIVLKRSIQLDRPRHAVSGLVAGVRHASNGKRLRDFPAHARWLYQTDPHIGDPTGSFRRR